MGDTRGLVGIGATHIARETDEEMKRIGKGKKKVRKREVLGTHPLLVPSRAHRSCRMAARCRATISDISHGRASKSYGKVREERPSVLLEGRRKKKRNWGTSSYLPVGLLLNPPYRLMDSSPRDD